jgi:hypothetical protein
MIQDLIGKRVIVTADGLVYSGVLAEVSEESVEIRTDQQWIILPMEKVSSIAAAQ